MRDVTTDELLAAPEKLARSGNCKKAVSTFVKARGLVSSSREAAIASKALKVIASHCTDELSREIGSRREARAESAGQEKRVTRRSAEESGLNVQRTWKKRDTRADPLQTGKRAEPAPVLRRRKEGSWVTKKKFYFKRGAKKSHRAYTV